MKTIGSRIHRVTSFALLVLAAGGIVATARGAEPATWKDQDLVLDYMGFTTHYSCDGLRDRVRTVLLQLGARPDLTVTSAGCTRTGGGPERFPSVRAHFATLQPAAEAATGAAIDAATGARGGAWKSVNLGGHNGLDEGECELGDEIVRTVLPHFAVRNVDWHAPCVPHTTSVALSLRLDVFAPQAPPQR